MPYPMTLEVTHGERGCVAGSVDLPPVCSCGHAGALAILRIDAAGMAGLPGPVRLRSLVARVYEAASGDRVRGGDNPARPGRSLLDAAVHLVIPRHEGPQAELPARAEHPRRRPSSPG